MTKPKSRKALLEEADAADQQELYEALSARYRQVEQEITRHQKANRRIELTVLIISVVTSGTLWTLLTQSLPSVAAWVGAISSTLVALFTAYQSSLGPKQKIEPLLKLYSQIGMQIANFEEGQRISWGNYKMTMEEAARIALPGYVPDRNKKALLGDDPGDFQFRA